MTPASSTVDLGPQQRDARLLQPEAGPGGQVAAAGGLELGEEVAQLGVAPRVLGEVGADAGEELVLAHPRHQLLEHARALGVGDAVEVDLDVLQVAHVRDDRVRRGQLVLPVGPVLLHRGERGPGAGPAGGLRRWRASTCTRRTTRSATGRPTSAWSPGRRTTCAPARAGSSRRGARSWPRGPWTGTRRTRGTSPRRRSPSRPALNSGTKSWSYLVNGYGTPNARS